MTLKSEIHDICPICFWQDDPNCWNNPDLASGANGISLREAQQNFNKFGACEKNVLDLVRKPGDTDNRDKNWRLF